MKTVRYMTLCTGALAVTTSAGHAGYSIEDVAITAVKEAIESLKKEFTTLKDGNKRVEEELESTKALVAKDDGENEQIAAQLTAMQSTIAELEKKAAAGGDSEEIVKLTKRVDELGEMLKTTAEGLGASLDAMNKVVTERGAANAGTETTNAQLSEIAQSTEELRQQMQELRQSVALVESKMERLEKANNGGLLGRGLSAIGAIAQGAGAVAQTVDNIKQAVAGGASIHQCIKRPLTQTETAELQEIEAASAGRVPDAETSQKLESLLQKVQEREIVQSPGFKQIRYCGASEGWKSDLAIPYVIEELISGREPDLVAVLGPNVKPTDQEIVSHIRDMLALGARPQTIKEYGIEFVYGGQPHIEVKANGANVAAGSLPGQGQAMMPPMQGAPGAPNVPTQSLGMMQAVAGGSPQQMTAQSASGYGAQSGNGGATAGYQAPAGGPALQPTPGASTAVQGVVMQQPIPGAPGHAGQSGDGAAALGDQAGSIPQPANGAHTAAPVQPQPKQGSDPAVPGTQTSGDGVAALGDQVGSIPQPANGAHTAAPAQPQPKQGADLAVPGAQPSPVVRPGRESLTQGSQCSPAQRPQTMQGARTLPEVGANQVPPGQVTQLAPQGQLTQPGHSMPPAPPLSMAPKTQGMPPAPSVRPSAQNGAVGSSEVMLIEPKSGTRYVVRSDEFASIARQIDR